MDRLAEKEFETILHNVNSLHLSLDIKQIIIGKISILKNSTKFYQHFYMIGRKLMEQNILFPHNFHHTTLKTIGNTSLVLSKDRHLVSRN